MKKLFLMSSMLLLTSGVFANEIAEEKKEQTKKSEEITSNTCCTATLTYQGQYYDHQESCSTFLTYAQNCAFAQKTLLDRNPAAKKALYP